MESFTKQKDAILNVGKGGRNLSRYFITPEKPSQQDIQLNSTGCQDLNALRKKASDEKERIVEKRKHLTADDFPRRYRLSEQEPYYIKTLKEIEDFIHDIVTVEEKLALTTSYILNCFVMHAKTR